MSSGLDGFIADWRASAIDESNADEDELKLRRMLAVGEAEIAREPSNNRSVTTGRLNREILRLANNIGLFTNLTRRQANKEIAILRNHVATLEARIRKLEAKAHPQGGK